MAEEAKESQKLDYHAPRLERYGTLSELTQTGNSHPGLDFQIYQNPPPEHYGSNIH